MHCSSVNASIQSAAFEVDGIAFRSVMDDNVAESVPSAQGKVRFVTSGYTFPQLGTGWLLEGEFLLRYVSCKTTESGKGKSDVRNSWFPRPSRPSSRYPCG